MQTSLSKHCYHSMRKRGVQEFEIIETIQECNWTKAKFNRFEAEKEFCYNSSWNNKFYKFKKVNPVFVKEQEAVIVITVYAFYYN